MIAGIFKNTYLFSALFFIVLIADVYIKTSFNDYSYRFISKGLVTVLLVAYYLVNHRETSKKRQAYLLMALSFFFLGDIFLILYETEILYLIGIFCFILGKSFYVFLFSNQRDFALSKLWPFLILCFIYMLVLLSLTYDNLGIYFYPVLIYLFIAMIVMLYGILRKGEVNLQSYYLVLTGIIFSVFSDSISVLESFYDENIAYNTVTIMLFYGVSQYFIVLGIVKETNQSILSKN